MYVYRHVEATGQYLVSSCITFHLVSETRPVADPGTRSLEGLAGQQAPGISPFPVVGLQDALMFVLKV